MSDDRLVPASDLVLQRDIAERTGLNPTLVANMASGHGHRARQGFPHPIAGGGTRGIWLWSEVAAWLDLIKSDTVEGMRAASSTGRTVGVRPAARQRH